MNEDDRKQEAGESGTVKGFVQTPDKIVDLMVNRLFSDHPPSPCSTVLDPGCGEGSFIAGIIRWCEARRVTLPVITGVELDPSHVAVAQAKFARYSSVRVERRDFLTSHAPQYDYIVGNPPYVPITELTTGERAHYRSMYLTASGRFDLYLLFFEQALLSLRPRGRIVFLTPEKFLYVETAAPLRRLLAARQLEEVLLLQEDVFGDLVTYPTITVLMNDPGPNETKVALRDGRIVHASFSADGSSWLPAVNGKIKGKDPYTLIDICRRVSCGVATGADSVFIKRTDTLAPALRPFAYPTIAGREIAPNSLSLRPVSCILVPYTRSGSLMEIKELGALEGYLSHSEVRRRLEGRTCVARKPWYAFHETPLLNEILRPKILCKDITAEPRFWLDHEGTLVPRHSVYYIVPKDPSHIEQLAEYLNSVAVKEWLWAHCQRASKGFLRIQSHVLKKIPIPQDLAQGIQEHLEFESPSADPKSPALVTTG